MNAALADLTGFADDDDLIDEGTSCDVYAAATAVKRAPPELLEQLRVKRDPPRPAPRVAPRQAQVAAPELPSRETVRPPSAPAAETSEVAPNSGTLALAVARTPLVPEPSAKPAPDAEPITLGLAAPEECHHEDETPTTSGVREVAAPVVLAPAVDALPEAPSEVQVQVQAAAVVVAAPKRRVPPSLVAAVAFAAVTLGVVGGVFFGRM